MKKYVTALALLCLCKYTNAQKECGTKAPPEQEYNNMLARAFSRPLNVLEGPRYVRVFIVNFLTSEGADSSWTAKEINDEFQLAKDLMKPYDICLVLVGVEHIKNTSLQNYNADDNAAALTAVSYHTNSLNIYLHNRLTSTSYGGLNGYAYELNADKLSLSRGPLPIGLWRMKLGIALGCCTLLKLLMV